MLEVEHPMIGVKCSRWSALWHIFTWQVTPNLVRSVQTLLRPIAPLRRGNTLARLAEQLVRGTERCCARVTRDLPPPVGPSRLDCELPDFALVHLVGQDSAELVQVGVATGAQVDEGQRLRRVGRASEISVESGMFACIFVC